jgi:hypothetical protein
MVRLDLHSSTLSSMRLIAHHAVRLGKSGLKVSKIILGCMSYGSPEWQPWVLGEEESIKHIKAASVARAQELIISAR